jgi:hypothetical protein
MIMKSPTSKKLLPSMLHATPAEVAAFRARLRDGSSGPEVHEATPEEVSAYRAHLALLPPSPRGVRVTVSLSEAFGEEVPIWSTSVG